MVHNATPQLPIRRAVGGGGGHFGHARPDFLDLLSQSEHDWETDESNSPENNNAVWPVNYSPSESETEIFNAGNLHGFANHCVERSEASSSPRSWVNIIYDVSDAPVYPTTILGEGLQRKSLQGRSKTSVSTDGTKNKGKTSKFFGLLACCFRGRSED